MQLEADAFLSCAALQDSLDSLFIAVSTVLLLVAKRFDKDFALHLDLPGNGIRALKET